MNGLLEASGIAPETFRTVINLKCEYLYLAFSKDVSDARVQRWQSALEAARRDGTVARIYRGVYAPAAIREVCRPGDPLAR